MKVLIITLSTLIILAISMLAFGFINKPVNAAVGDTIAKTFPDANLAQAVADKSCAYDDDPAIFMLASKDSKKIEAVYDAGTQHNQSLEETFDIIRAWRSLGFEIRVIQND